MAMTAVAVAARKRRRGILLLSIVQSSHGVPARAPLLSAGPVARRPVQLHAVTGRKLRSNSPRLSVEISTPASRRRDIMRPGGDRSRAAVEAQRQAEGGAAAAQERGERRGRDVAGPPPGVRPP